MKPEHVSLFTPLLIHLFTQTIFDICCFPGTVLGFENIALNNKTDKIVPLKKLTFYWKKQTIYIVFGKWY